jgi:hypothetical protein
MFAAVLMDEKVPGKQKSGRDAHFSQKGFLNSVPIISYSYSYSNTTSATAARQDTLAQLDEVDVYGGRFD